MVGIEEQEFGWEPMAPLIRRMICDGVCDEHKDPDLLSENHGNQVTHPNQIICPISKP